MLKPCWVTFTFLGFQSVRGDINELQNDSSSTETFLSSIYRNITFYSQGLQTRFSGCSNNSHATNIQKKILITQYQTAMLFKQKKNKGQNREFIILNTLTSFSDSNMPALNAFFKLNSFVMISSPFSSLYEKQRSINMNITFVSETKGITPGTAHQDRS